MAIYLRQDDFSPILGPFTSERAEELLRKGRFDADALVSNDKRTWYPAGRTGAFAHIFQSLGPPPPGDAMAEIAQATSSLTKASAPATSASMRASAVLPEGGQPSITKPGKVSAIGGLRLGAGICNIIAGLVFFIYFIIPLALIPLGIIEIISASNLLKARPEPPSGLYAIAILEIVAILTLAGWISVVAGILTLVFLADPKVKAYLDLWPAQG